VIGRGSSYRNTARYAVGIKKRDGYSLGGLGERSAERCALLLVTKDVSGMSVPELATWSEVVVTSLDSLISGLEFANYPLAGRGIDGFISI